MGVCIPVTCEKGRQEAGEVIILMQRGNLECNDVVIMKLMQPSSRPQIMSLCVFKFLIHLACNKITITFKTSRKEINIPSVYLVPMSHTQDTNIDFICLA